MPAKHVSKRYIIIVLTGIPGTGKTSLAHSLAPLLHARVLAEKSFMKKKGVGKWNSHTKEYDVDLPALRNALLSRIQKTKHNLILEGHLLCEIRLPAHYVIITHAPRSTLEKRLSSRGYSQVKIQENVFCEEDNYCGKAALKNYSRTRTLNVSTHRPKKGVTRTVLRWMNQLDNV